MSELAGPARPPRAALPLDILARLRERGLDDPAFDAVLSLAVRVGGAGLTMVGQILAARVMGIAEFGAFANAWVWAMLVAVLAQVGFATTTTRFGCAYRANGTAAELRGLLVFSQGLVLATGLLAAGTVVAVAALAGPHLSQGQREALMMGALCVPILAQIDVGKGLARVSGSAAMAYLPGMLARPAVFLGGLFVLVQTGVALDGARALAIMLAASLAAWAFQALLVRARLSPLLKERGVSWHRRDWLAASRGVVVSDAYLLFVASIDVILLNLLASAEAGGRYFAAAKLAALLSYVLFAISAVAQGRLAMLVAEGREADLRRQARTFCAWAFWPTAAAAGALALAGPFLLQLFGPGRSASCSSWRATRTRSPRC